MPTILTLRSEEFDEVKCGRLEPHEGHMWSDGHEPDDVNFHWCPGTGEDPGGRDSFA